MFWPILFLAIIRLDTIIGENYTIYNMIQYRRQCLVVILYPIIYCVVFSDNLIYPDDGQKCYWPKQGVDVLCIIDNIVVL